MARTVLAHRCDNCRHENRQLCWAVAIALTAILAGCSSGKTPSQPLRPSESVSESVTMSVSATMSSTGPPPLTTAIAVPFDPSELTFSGSANKLYVDGMEGDPIPVMRSYVVSLSGPAGPIKRFDTLIGNMAYSIVINDKLRRGYALVVSGVPHADIHGLLHYVGVMDPFCGGTRSMYLTLHGHLREAVRYNPAGPLLALAAVAMLVRAASGRSTGYWVSVRMPRMVWIPLLVVAVSALEINQQLHAALLSQPWSGP
jgi:hypothetical protein